MDLLNLGGEGVDAINLDLATRIVDEDRLDDESTEPGIVVFFGPKGRSVIRGPQAELLRRFVREHATHIASGAGDESYSASDGVLPRAVDHAE